MPPAISATLQEVLELDQANKLSEALAKLDSFEDQISDEPNIQKIVGLLYQRLNEDEKSLRFHTSAAVSLPDDAAGRWFNWRSIISIICRMPFVLMRKTLLLIPVSCVGESVKLGSWPALISRIR